MAHLALRDQALHFAPGLLDWCVAVDIVELQQVDVVALQPAQACLEVGADHLRPEVHPVAPLLVGQGAALREDEDVLAAAQCAPDDLFRPAPAVEGRRVDPVDTEVECGVDRANGLTLVLRSPPSSPVAPRSDRRRADTDRSDLHVCERAGLHAATLRKLLGSDP